MTIRAIFFAVLIGSFGLASLPARAADSDPVAAAAPEIAGQVTFLYYKDLEAAAEFYGEVLKLRKTFDKEWVKFFQITDNSYVGLVDETRGFHKTTDTKPVMLSIITTDVADWYAYMQQQNANFLTHYKPDGNHEFVAGFLVEDPGGYTVEFFEWK